MPYSKKQSGSSRLLVRWCLGILTLVVVIILGAQLFAALFLDKIIGDYLKAQVSNSSAQVYQLRYEDLDINLFTTSTRLQNVHLTPDSTSIVQRDNTLKNVPLLAEAHIPELAVSNVSLWQALFRNTLSVESIAIDRPSITVEEIYRNRQLNKQKFKSLDSTLMALISPGFSAFELNRFSIEHARFSLMDENSTKSKLSVKDLGLQLRNIRIDSASIMKKKLFITDDIELNVSGFSMESSREYYRLTTDRFVLSSASRHIVADSVRLEPLLPRYEFSRKWGYQTDRIDMTISRFHLDNVNFTAMVDSGHFYAAMLKVDSTEVNIFRNKKLPLPPGHAPGLLHLTFRNLSQPIKIDSVSIQKSDIVYTEHRKGVPKPGTIRFVNLQTAISDLSNYNQDLKNGHKTTMQAQTEVMGKGILKSYFTFFMSDPNGSHTIYGNFGSMKIAEFNPVLEHLAYVHVESGIIHNMEFSMKLDLDNASGWVLLNYENLSLELLQSETLDQGIGQGIKSFIANTFVIQESNSTPPLRKGKIKFDRVELKSVFSYWWKSLASGIKNSIGL
jgi:hypothetical protein